MRYSPDRERFCGPLSASERYGALGLRALLSIVLELRIDNSLSVRILDKSRMWFFLDSLLFLAPSELFYVCKLGANSFPARPLWPFGIFFCRSEFDYVRCRQDDASSNVMSRCGGSDLLVLVILFLTLTGFDDTEVGSVHSLQRGFPNPLVVCIR
jgi:hypothetical protein